MQERSRLNRAGCRVRTQRERGIYEHRCTSQYQGSTCHETVHMHRGEMRRGKEGILGILGLQKGVVNRAGCDRGLEIVVAHQRWKPSARRGGYGCHTLQDLGQVPFRAHERCGHRASEAKLNAILLAITPGEVLYQNQDSLTYGMRPTLRVDVNDTWWRWR